MPTTKKLATWLWTQIRKELTTQSVPAVMRNDYKYTHNDVWHAAEDSRPALGLYRASGSVEREIAANFRLASPVLRSHYLRMVFFIEDDGVLRHVDYDCLSSGPTFQDGPAPQKIQENKILKNGLNGIAMFLVICVGVAVLVL